MSFYNVITLELDPQKVDTFDEYFDNYVMNARQVMRNQADQMDRLADSILSDDPVAYPDDLKNAARQNRKNATLVRSMVPEIIAAVRANRDEIEKRYNSARPKRIES